MKQQVQVLGSSPMTIAARPLRCPKKHRFRPISFDEETGVAVFICKCGIERTRKAKFICNSDGVFT